MYFRRFISHLIKSHEIGKSSTIQNKQVTIRSAHIYNFVISQPISVEQMIMDKILLEVEGKKW